MSTPRSAGALSLWLSLKRSTATTPWACTIAVSAFDGDEAGSPTATLGRNSASRRSKAFVNVVREAKTAQGSPAGVGSP